MGSVRIRIRVRARVWTRVGGMVSAIFMVRVRILFRVML